MVTRGSEMYESTECPRRSISARPRSADAEQGPPRSEGIVPHRGKAPQATWEGLLSCSYRADDFSILQQGREGLRRLRVGEQAVDLRQCGQLHHGWAVELAEVAPQPDLSCVFDDGLRHLHFAVVEVAQGAIGLDARDAYERNVHLELADEVHRRFADDAPVAGGR